MGFLDFFKKITIEKEFETDPNTGESVLKNGPKQYAVRRNDGIMYLRTVNYKDGILEGPYEEKQYFGNGKLHFRAAVFYHNGEKEGVEKIYAADGEVLGFYTWKNGVMNGSAREPYVTPQMEGKYENGEREGV